jgi:ornithine carbamoyltransferase
MQKHLISLADLSQEDLWHILNTAQELKEEWQAGGNQPILTGKCLGMIFQKPSLRTRVSFEVGMLHLGGEALYLSPNEIQLGKRESVEDVGRVVSRYVDCIMARVFAHDHIETLAAYASCPVINGLSDYNHPCQALADLLTILEKKGSFGGFKLAWVGDGNNVLTSLLFGASKMGMDIAVATPQGYEPSAEVVDLAFRFARDENSQSQIEIGNDPHAAVRNADMIYTDTWTSMGQEAEKQRRLQVFPPYQVGAELVAEANPDVIVMHCLPAHRGEEITDEVADGPHSVIFDQAENRMHAQKGLLAVLLANK